MANEPFEVVIAPARVWVAPVGEPFPGIGDTPAGNWAHLGTSEFNYDESGVIVRASQSLYTFRGLASTVPLKSGYTEKSVEAEFALADMNPEEILYALGGDPDNGITDTPAGGGEPGDVAFDFPINPVPLARAILVRSETSPFGDGFNTQFEIYNGVATGNPEFSYRKDQAALVRFMYLAHLDSNGNFVRFRFQDEATSP